MPGCWHHDCPIIRVLKHSSYQAEHTRADVMNRKQILMPVFIVLLAIATAKAQTYITVDVPGAGSGPGQGTFAQTVSDSGIVYGNYVGSNSVAHGFLRSTE